MAGVPGSQNGPFSSAKLNEFGEIEIGARDGKTEEGGSATSDYGLAEERESRMPSQAELFAEKYGPEFSLAEVSPSRSALQSPAYPRLEAGAGRRRSRRWPVLVLLLLVLVIILGAGFYLLNSTAHGYSNEELAERYGRGLAYLEIGDNGQAAEQFQWVVNHKADYKEVATLLNVARNRAGSSANGLAKPSILPSTSANTSASTSASPNRSATTISSAVNSVAAISGQPTLSATTAASPTSGAIATVALQAQSYDQGLQAYYASNWADAIEKFEKVRQSVGLNYQEVKSLLARSYYNRGLELEQNGVSAPETLAAFEAALKLEPSLEDAANKRNLLQAYVEAAKLVAEQRWAESLEALASLQRTQPDYRDSTGLTYAARLGLGDQLLAAGKPAEALQQYQQANTLPVDDKSALASKIAQANQMLQPTATPTAVPSPTPYVIYAPAPAAPAPVQAAPAPVQAAPTATPVLPTATAEPPSPTPLPTATSRGCYSNFYAYNIGQPPVADAPDLGSSSVTGLIINRNKQPIAGALIRVMTDSYSFNTYTNGGGRYSLGGLGKANWYVTVLAAPEYIICTSLSARVQLSGQPGFTATADFVESEP